MKILPSAVGVPSVFISAFNGLILISLVVIIPDKTRSRL